MKRIHLFEFEDLPWFPNWIRECMTLYIETLHRTVDTASAILPLVQRGLAHSESKAVIDLCSGAGGPMLEVIRRLRESSTEHSVQLTLTDLYPNARAGADLKKKGCEWARYHGESIDASNVPQNLNGMRTMICSLHHMRPEIATKILADAALKKQPFLAFEISDNSSPLWLWWLAIPIGFLLSLFLTPRVRPLTLRQIFFTYVIPVIPFFLAWDGAVSNARTYTQEDLQQLLHRQVHPDYEWETGSVKNPSLPGSMLYLLGVPSTKRSSERNVDFGDSPVGGTHPCNS